MMRFAVDLCILLFGLALVLIASEFAGILLIPVPQ